MSTFTTTCPDCGHVGQWYTYTLTVSEDVTCDGEPGWADLSCPTCGAHDTITREDWLDRACERATMKALDFDHPNDTGWKDRHLAAIGQPRGFEKPIVNGIRAWLDYAKQHQLTYESGIGEDGVLGKAWIKWGEALYGLLDGDRGRLDCGTLSTIINDNLVEQGVGR